MSKALREIEAHFEMYGFSLGKIEDLQQLPVENGKPQDKEHREVGAEEQEEEGISEDSHGEDDDSAGSTVFDREEIEVAIDVFLTDLVRAGIIPKYPRNKLPSLEGVFEEIFGEDHEIIKTVQSFEEHIEGYFDVVGYEDMETAANQLGEIRDMINKELGGK